MAGPSAQEGEGEGEGKTTTASAVGRGTWAAADRRLPSPPPAQLQRQPSVTLCVVDSKYEVIKEAGRALGMRLVEADDNRCNIYWVDASVIGERLARLAPWQRINHFPGMAHIARKNRLAQNLATMRRRFPREYGFYPKTWVLPHDAKDFCAQFDAHGRALTKGVTFILKPENSSKGRGIFLTKSLDKVALAEPQVAQVYISRPLLLDGFKFDIRMYALVTSCSPLRMYKYTDGLVRLCTSEYARPSAANLENRFMHLTNSAINRLSSRYETGGGKRGGAMGQREEEDAEEEEEREEDETGSKRSLRWFLDWVRRRHGEARAAALWRDMGEICVKTVLSILPTLARDYKALFGPHASLPPSASGNGEGAAGAAAAAAAAAVWGSRAFELLGFDIMVDQALKPWLVEVNTLPSFATDSEVDREVKRGLITQTLSVVQAQPTDRRVYLERKKAEATERLHRARLRTDRLMHALQDEANVVVQTRRRIEELFARHAPERMEAVDRLMSKNKGREASLLCRLLRYFRQYKGEGADGGGGVAQQQQQQQQLLRRRRSSLGDQEEWGVAAEGPESEVANGGGLLGAKGDGAGGTSTSSSTSSASRTTEESTPPPSSSGAAAAAAAAAAAGPLTESEEMARLADFERIYPPLPGQPDTYAPLVAHVWEKEHKLLRGNAAAARSHASSPGGSGGDGEEALRRRLLSRLSSATASVSSEQPDESNPSPCPVSDAAPAPPPHYPAAGHQRQREALAVLDLLGKAKAAPGRRRSEADDARLDDLLLSLVSDDPRQWRRRSGSSSSGGGGASLSSSTTGSSLSSSIRSSVSSSSINAQQAAAAARLSRGYSSREQPTPTTTTTPAARRHTMHAAAARVETGGLADRMRANERSAKERRQGLRSRLAGRQRLPAGASGPLPGFALLKPTLLDVSVLGQERIPATVSDYRRQPSF